MNQLIVLFTLIFFNRKNIKINIINKIDEYLKLPIWHKPNILCETDDDCPIPFSCCHDAFFPMENKYCCSNYKKREYKYAYIYNK